MNLLKFLSLNVGMQSSLAGLPALIELEGFDVVLLQEVRFNSEHIESLVKGFEASVNIDPDNPSCPGTAIVWRKGVPVEGISILKQCRLQLASIGSLKILNVYAPSGSNQAHARSTFYSDVLFKAIMLDQKAQWVIGGDHNCVLQRIDLENGVGFMQKKCLALENIVRVMNFQDAFRCIYPNTSEFTFYRAGSTPSRLDRFYILSGLVKNIVSVGHVASLADHLGVKLTLKVNYNTVVQDDRLKSYWKLNLAILLEDNFHIQFKKFWELIHENISQFQVCKIGN